MTTTIGRTNAPIRDGSNASLGDLLACVLENQDYDLAPIAVQMRNHALDDLALISEALDLDAGLSVQAVRVIDRARDWLRFGELLEKKLTEVENEESEGRPSDAHNQSFPRKLEPAQPAALGKPDVVTGPPDVMKTLWSVLDDIKAIASDARGNVDLLHANARDLGGSDLLSPESTLQLVNDQYFQFVAEIGTLLDYVRDVGDLIMNGRRRWEAKS